MTAPPARQEVVLERELGISHADLQRILPRVVAPASVRRLAGALAVDYADGRSLVIDYGPERQRRLGALRLPYTALRFRFVAWSPDQRVDFMKKIQQAFHKGGG